MIRVVENDLRKHIAYARAAIGVLHPTEFARDIWQAPLCVRFITPFKICTGCPVREKTGKLRCVGSPRIKVLSTLAAWKATLEDIDAFTALGKTDKVATAKAKALKTEAAYRAAASAWADWLEALL